MNIRLEQVNNLRNLGMAEFVVSGTDAGCDDFSFGHMDWALQLLVAAGFSEMEALQSATSGAARACGVGAEVGNIRSGHLADILIVEGNPLENMAVVANVRAIFKSGSEVSLAQSVWSNLLQS
jgi:imidazolonepropionase-like amidohydrolase